MSVPAPAMPFSRHLSASASRLCVTRVVKNARRLQTLLPAEFPAVEPKDGYATWIPFDLLQRLHRLRLSEATRSHPRLQLLAEPLGPPSPAKTGANGTPLFSGTLRFLAAQFATGPVANIAVPPSDLDTAINYATRVSGAISRYASQYGANRILVAPGSIPSTFPIPGGRFNDATVRGWVDGLVGSGSLGNADCAVLLAPRGVTNTDAPVDQGVLGYHGAAKIPYLFVNVTGTGLRLDDPSDLFALALSHEIAEMTVDPMADSSHPEVCDPCGPNCQMVYRDYFDAHGTYVGTSTTFPPPYSYGWFINGIVRPASSAACPAPADACVYAPP
jgi:hypothetical protein